MIKKKKILILSLIILSMLLISIYIIKQKDDSKIANSYSNLNMVEGVSKSMGLLNITVDPRIELLTAIQQQAGYERLTRFDFTYKDKMKEHFNQFKNHEAVKLFNSLSIKGFGYDAPPTVMLYLSNDLTLKENNPIPDELIARSSGQNNISKFISEIRNFSYESNFNNFYSQNTAFYQAMIDNLHNNIKDMELIQTLDNYYGMEVNSYNLILSPLIHSGGYGPRIKADNGLYDVYGIIGPENISDNDGVLVPEYSSEFIQHLVWHEFGHSFVNPTTEKYINEINKYDELFSKIEQQMNSQAYKKWETCVNEHIIRAITARLIYQTQGQFAYDAVINTERANGFYYVPALCESLANYEINRDKYPTFESYYPKLIEVFKELSEQNLDDEFFKLDFLGPINSAFNNIDSMNVAIIISTHEKDPKIQDEITSYVKKVKEFFPNAEIIKDTEAIHKDLGDYIVVAYGTIEGNAWLQKYEDSFPFKIENNRIIADKTYDDTDMIMISAVPNPQNYKNPLIIYTAQDAKDIVNINNIFHGPTDYIIVKDGKELSSGFYAKDEETWSFQQ